MRKKKSKVLRKNKAYSFKNKRLFIKTTKILDNEFKNAMDRDEYKSSDLKK